MAGLGLGQRSVRTIQDPAGLCWGGPFPVRPDHPVVSSGCLAQAAAHGGTSRSRPGPSCGSHLPPAPPRLGPALHPAPWNKGGARKQGIPGSQAAPSSAADHSEMLPRPLRFGCLLGALYQELLTPLSPCSVPTAGWPPAPRGLGPTLPARITAGFLKIAPRGCHLYHLQRAGDGSASECQIKVPAGPAERPTQPLPGQPLWLGPGFARSGCGAGVPPGFEKCGPPRKGQGVGVGGLLLWDAPTCLGL